MDSVSKKLKAYKDANKLTNEQIARKIDVPLVSVTRWIKGNPMSKAYKRIVEAFLNKVGM